MARRYRSLHFNLKEGENVVFHREHRSKKGRAPYKTGKLQKYERSSRRKWKNYAKVMGFFDNLKGRKGKKGGY